MTQKFFQVSVPTDGRLFIMPRPGRHELGDVIAALARRRVTTVVCLIPEGEMTSHALAAEREHCLAHAIDFRHFPISDLGVPDPAAFTVLTSQLASELQQGRSLAIHCQAGIGRTGTLASCILRELGHDALTAMELVASARGVAHVPETAEQRRFVIAYVPAASG